MIVYGYAKQISYKTDNSIQIQVRIPSIHGPYKQSDAKGKTIHNYTRDDDLPWYPSLSMNRTINDGDVVALINTNNSDTNADFLVIGATGASYKSQS